MSGPAIARRVPSLRRADPRHERAVVEAEDQLHAHRHPAALALHDPDEVGGVVARRHEVDERDRARRRSRTSVSRISVSVAVAARW